MTLFTEFQRVSRSAPCPICGRPDWCLIGRDNTDRVLCQRVASPLRWKNAGWIHGPARGRLVRTRTVGRLEPTRDDLEALAARFELALSAEMRALAAHTLGLSEESLMRLRAGLAGAHDLIVEGFRSWPRALTFPMEREPGRVVGIRLRMVGGDKFAIRGGREGIFVPRGFDPAAPVLVAEGPTDTAALIGLGFNAIGRPSCTGGRAQIIARIKHAPSVAVVADRDGPGQAGAQSLALALRAHVTNVRLVTPPGPFKDAREWVRGGATHADIAAAINAAEPVGRLRITVSGGGAR